VEDLVSAVGISAAIGTRVTRGSKERNTAETNLLELSVDADDVLLGVNTELLAFLATNTVLALLSL